MANIHDIISRHLPCSRFVIFYFLPSTVLGLKNKRYSNTGRQYSTVVKSISLASHQDGLPAFASCYYVTLGKFLNLPKGSISSTAKQKLGFIYLVVMVRIERENTWKTLSTVPGLRRRLSKCLHLESINV